MVLHKVAQNDVNHDETNPETIKRIQKEVDERLTACLYLEISDKKKHGEVLKYLNPQQTLKNDQCPKNFIDVTSVLS